MRVAIIHDWLVTKAGAESVLEQMLSLYPDADVFTVVDFLPEQQKKAMGIKKVVTSFIQRLPKARKKYRTYLPLMPIAVEQFDLSGYDLVLSSSHAVAKGVITGPDQLHISYVHTPIRYAWDLQHSYLKEVGLHRGIKGVFARIILHYIRIWDYRTSLGVDHLVANSRFIARRIRKVYGRQADVVYPPVHVESFSLCTKKEAYYLTASRFVPYKKIPLIVEAFSKMPDKKLVVIGDGPEEKSAKAVASANVEFLGHVTRECLIDYMQRARAFVFAAEEDFGIVPVEAQACGTPVIAFAKGGVTETVVDGKTGLFFHEQTVESLIDAVNRFEKKHDRFDPVVVREHALKFGVDVFKKKFKDFVESKVKSSKE